ncbi:GNAT family N-acetyltransferase [Alkalihalophilus lindianensis]|uniref:GNAT family N-acetyltransferase n=1 Tax=Alkalihalophilus lindianensis TaxID=1630542 RepID=A0ABU3XCD0_9BACI|nr:GNAT family N-acetyltransferase [Alkalihalophilus lindianensis]MDV2685542.1 GNAT family N-acetyltransferase [Alkalihalophilus lindianensis]
MITYKENQRISPEQLAEVFFQSTIKRPYTDLTRLKKMIEASPLLITAWDDGKLVGVARSLTDFSYCCYLSDLAVREDYQRKGIGEELIKRTKEAIGPTCSLVLLSAPDALDYYPKVGFKKADHAFFIQRDI